MPAAGVVLLWPVLVEPGSAAQAVDVAPAVVVSPEGQELTEGGSATPFTLRLPDRASCPGDSANAGWRVNSYMVPEAVDVATLPYDGTGPTPYGLGDLEVFRQPLYTLRTDPYVSAQTLEVEVPGDPGEIIDIPDFSFAVFAPGDVPPGRYHLGIACTLLNEVALVWDAEVVVTAAPADAPAQLHWRVAEPSVSSPNEGQWAPALSLLGVAGGLVALVAVSRRQRPPISAGASREEE
ncbi:MAG: hypothetical protein ABL966_03270 [Acidimicrobiales bacterium]